MGGYLGLFPAYAGVILPCCSICWISSAFPRLRGGDPDHNARIKEEQNFSPPAQG